MTDRECIERAVISSILQGGDKVKDLCNEFGITESFFENFNLGMTYSLIMIGNPSAEDFPEEITYFVPTSDNARYYLEELSSLQKKLV